MTESVKQFFKLNNPILDYAWGSRTAIADLLGTKHSDRPQAELWMGAHPKAPSTVLWGSETVTLIELIDAYPEAILGSDTARRFNARMPFLFKILAAAEPLSIQAHPNVAQAREGFARENQLGIPLDAAQRNYRDNAHKPEIICALTPFWALNGFQPLETIRTSFRSFAPYSMAPLVTALESGDGEKALTKFFETLLILPAPDRQKIIGEVVEQARTRGDADPAAKWIMRLQAAYPGDVGILAPIYLNLVRLAPGQAMSLTAGRLHAYLEGVGIELMANSDNVLRGGLTTKHIDTEELMRIVTYDADAPRIISPPERPRAELIYPSAAAEFELGMLSITGNRGFRSAARRRIEIILAVDGAVVFETGSKRQCRLGKGESIMVPACMESYSIRGEGRLYRATVPDPHN